MGFMVHPQTPNMYWSLQRRIGSPIESPTGSHPNDHITDHLGWDPR